MEQGLREFAEQPVLALPDSSRAGNAAGFYPGLWRSQTQPNSQPKAALLNLDRPSHLSKAEPVTSHPMLRDHLLCQDAAGEKRVLSLK